MNYIAIKFKDDTENFSSFDTWGDFMKALVQYQVTWPKTKQCLTVLRTLHTVQQLVHLTWVVGQHIQLTVAW